MPSPNPANSSASFTLRTERPEHVHVAAYDALGREVVVLFEGSVTGAQPLRFDASGLPAGVYVVRAQGETFTETRPVSVVR
ncbi:MAG TPA: T9SS type A sorting domain-containing protein [Rubricoccaceae bacterium]|nr:T9SS type A sorting domain-containing protein [Rubricoccaceae bacterium]